MKIVICGSMTSSKKMVEVEGVLASLGHEVNIPEFTREYAELQTVDHMHTESARNKVEHDLIKKYYNKIRNCDAVLVVNELRHNIQGYIGGNSFLEMGFAHILDKKIFLLNPVPEIGYRDELLAMCPFILNGDLTNIN